MHFRRVSSSQRNFPDRTVSSHIYLLPTHFSPLLISFISVEYLLQLMSQYDTLLLTEVHHLHQGSLFVSYILWILVLPPSKGTHVLEIPTVLTITCRLPNSCHLPSCVLCCFSYGKKQTNKPIFGTSCLYQKWENERPERNASRFPKSGWEQSLSFTHMCWLLSPNYVLFEMLNILQTSSSCSSVL